MKVKQRIKNIYHAYKSTCLFGFINSFLNLFFRHNNLIWAFIKARLKGNTLTYGKNCVFKNCKFQIIGTGNIITIKDNCVLRGLRIYMCSGRNRIVIGENTIVNASKEQRTLFNPCEGGEIIIGSDCLFSNSIELHTTDYHKILVNGQRTNEPKNINIGSHCWIGLQTLILKGTRLPDNCIVGARSLLNKEFEAPNSLIVGNPACIVKANIEWTM